MSGDFGIDYGGGTANVGRGGIRFGIIPMSALADGAWEVFDPDYGDPTCPACGGLVVEHDEEEHGHYKGRRRDYACEACERAWDSDRVLPDEPLRYVLDDGAYKAVVQDGDVWVLGSPHYTTAQFCSPCAPGACYLLNYREGGPRAFCLGHEWFQGPKCPYPYWDVATGGLAHVPTGEGAESGEEE